jgi:FkbM family methyltransferase
MTEIASALKKQIADARKNTSLVKATGGGGTLLDLGANIGEVTIGCAPQFDRSVAIEANPKTAEVLKARVQALPRVKVINAVVAATSGETFFVSDPSYCSTGATARRKKKRRDRQYFEVPSISFKSLIADYRPRVIKMDIEGSEFECLDGFQFPPCVRSLIVEFHGQEEAVRRIVAGLEAQGFHVQLNESPGWSLRTGIFTRSQQKEQTIMSDDATRYRYAQIQKLLDLFEATNGRPASTPEELNSWVGSPAGKAATARHHTPEGTIIPAYRAGLR